MNEPRPVRHCPKCGSVRVHRSRRRGPLERLFATLGADICRCHDCRTRKAWFGISPVPIGSTDSNAGPWSVLTVFASGCAACLVLLWWIVRYTG